MTDPWAPLVWIDCEMTGLDPDQDHILEIHCLVTDGNLQPVVLNDPGWGAVVRPFADQDALDALLVGMDDWCTSHHAASGLTAAIRRPDALSPEEAAAGLLAYVRARVPMPRVALLAGNSVHADRAFLRRPPYAPVMQHLHYRILDVSSIKEAARRWAPAAAQGLPPPSKTNTHRAREDILESIAEAQYYKETIFSRK